MCCCCCNAVVVFVVGVNISSPCFSKGDGPRPTRSEFSIGRRGEEEEEEEEEEG